MLNFKQEAFCLHFAKTGNATESYKKAGYNCKNDNTAGANARRLLQNDKIRARLAELSAEFNSEKIASIREIQERLTAIMRCELMAELMQPKDVIKAGEILARMQGGFDSKLQVELTVPIFDGDDSLED